jgi:hypothetical protein
MPILTVISRRERRVIEVIVGNVYLKRLGLSAQCELLLLAVFASSMSFFQLRMLGAASSSASILLVVPRDF